MNLFNLKSMIEAFSTNYGGGPAGSQESDGRLDRQTVEPIRGRLVLSIITGLL